VFEPQQVALPTNYHNGGILKRQIKRSQGENTGERALERVYSWTVNKGGAGGEKIEISASLARRWKITESRLATQTWKVGLPSLGVEGVSVGVEESKVEKRGL